MKLGRSRLDLLLRPRRLGGWMRWQAGVRDRAPVGEPAARVTFFTPSTKRARSGGTPGRLDHQERTDDRSE